MAASVQGCTPLGEINRISPERVKREKEKEVKNHPQVLC